MVQAPVPFPLNAGREVMLFGKQNDLPDQLRIIGNVKPDLRRARLPEAPEPGEICR